MAPFLVILLTQVFLQPIQVSADGLEVFNDVLSPLRDEDRALQLKNEQFWRPILRAAMGAQQHAQLYKDTEAAIAELDEVHSHVKKALEEALAALRKADMEVWELAKREATLAKEKLSDNEGQEMDASLLSLSGAGALASAVKSLFFGGVDTYNVRMRTQAEERQADMLPALQSAAQETADVIEACHTASERSFDVLKYDLYVKGVPRTPASTRRVANRLVDAAMETKSGFMKLTKASVQGISTDVISNNEAQAAPQNAAAAVDKALEQDSQPLNSEEV